ncbi:MAG: FlgO family outer membrane protein [Ostreibacterium sp.]
MKKHLLLAILVTAISGCAPDIFNEGGSKSANHNSEKDASLIASSRQGAENLVKQAAYLKNDLKPVLVTSIANITNLDRSSALGLMISEQISNRLAQFGFPVIDIRTRKDIKVRQSTGEFMLSRDVQKISKQHSAGAVLLGTYAAGQKTVYISTRLVRPKDSRILASYDFALPIGPDTQKLLRSRVK